MIARYALPAVLSPALALSAALGWAMWSRAALKAETAALGAAVAALEDARDQAREAYRVADAHRKREAARAARLDASNETLLTGDLTNADLSIDPRITCLLERLRNEGDPDACAGGAH